LTDFKSINDGQSDGNQNGEDVTGRETSCVCNKITIRFGRKLGAEYSSWSDG